MKSRQGAAGVLVLLAAVLGVLLLGGAATAATDAPGQEQQREVTANATVDESEPQIDTPFDITATVERAAEGDINGTVLIQEATLTDPAGDVEVTETDPSLLLRPNGSQDVTFEGVEIDEPGITELEVTVQYTSLQSARTYTLDTSVEVVVNLPAPVVDVDTVPAPNGTDRTVSLSVGNPLDESIQRVDVGITPADGDPFRVVNGDRSIPVLEPGETQELAFEVRDAPLGTHDLDVSLGFRSPQGEFWETGQTVTADFVGPSNPTTVDVVGVSVSGFPTGVRVTGSVVASGGTAVDGVTVAPADEPGIEPARPSPDAFVTLANGTAPTFEVTADLAENRSSIPLRLEYRTDGVDRTATVEVPYEGPREVAPVQLTDLTTVGGESVTIGGSVANTQDVGVAGVTVRVADVEGVEPGRSPEFFVGSIDAGSFGPFEEVTARITGDRATVPIEITYVLEGTQYSTVVEVDHRGVPSGGAGAGGDSSAPEFDPGGDDGGSGGDGDGGPSVVLLGAAGIVVAAAVGGLVVYRRRG